ncbi:MAG: type II toxin-antitoxin system RelE/ParE family toxin [Candidatus Methylumidiphilus alinenensis]|uniref:Type II toxin-antitoxin system RelE/ParE family toxin n=1 Tax=Candidatus Methylumidiphilus alinenensis TaxID=2202197 RepID=A0A2W4SKB2_9GAMM|nr:MAG: type II toxin-antitoxin system RelE/ParE family toxin [Candidatus Methylumidiphilus alinenensis]
MASYKLIWKRSAEKELRRIPQDAIARLLALAESLTDNPLPTGYKKLVGTEETYRVRSGDYRLVYEVRDKQLIIEIIRVGHRGSVYQ